MDQDVTVRISRIRKLGRGSYSSVYRVYLNDDISKTKVAKFFRKSFFSEKHLNSEKRAIERIGNSKYISNLEKIIETKTHWIALYEDDNAQDLIDFINLGQTKEERIKYQFEIMEDILCGLLEMHELNVIHSDIKCDNIIVFQDKDKWSAKYIDFGFAEVFDRKSEHFILDKTDGSIEYIAPEKMVEFCFYDGKLADIYSLGVVMYCLLRGLYPWNKLERQEIFRDLDIKNHPEPEYGDLSEIETEFLKGFLAISPTKRRSLKNSLEYFRTKMKNT